MGHDNINEQYMLANKQVLTTIGKKRACPNDI